MKALHEASLPPRSKDPPLVQAFKFGARPYEYLAELAREVGDPFTLTLPGDAPRVVFSDPALVRQTFALKADDYELRGQAFPLNIGENALIFLDGERHRRDRTVMTPHLHGERLRGYAATMSSTTREAIGRWSPGDRLAVHPELQEITLEILLRCVFGFADHERLRAPLLEWMHGTLTPFVFFSGMLVGLARVRGFLDSLVARASAHTRTSDRGTFDRRAVLDWCEERAFDVIPLARAARAKAEVMRLLREDVERCRRDGADGRTDVLALLAESRYEDGSPMDVDHVVDELVTLLVGGHETTANTLAWVLAYVLPRDDVRRSITAELERVFAGRPVAPERASELVYLDACIKEAMRLSPIAVAAPRPLTKSLDFGGYRLAPGTILWPSVILTHRRADLWPEPDRYRPERFVDLANPPTNHFFPFGGGRRACLGMAFAGMEMRIVLAEIFSRLDVRLARGSRVEPSFRGVTVAPSANLSMEIVGVRDQANARSQGEVAVT